MLPYALAFVVHFSADTDARLERATGRVEHLVSGRRATFASPGELLDGIRALLGEASACEGRRSQASASKEEEQEPKQGLRG